MVITIEVNQKKLEAQKGETILSALNRNGIRIPTLCRMADFSPTGACRLCVVEIEGRKNLVTACSQPVVEWMKIQTHSPRVIKARRTILELLLASHPDDCLYCDRNLNCELQRLAEELNIRERRIQGRHVKTRLDQSSPSIVRELTKCILCGRCVRVCEEQVTATSLEFINRGAGIHIGTSMDRDLNFSSCLHCGQCVQVCPTGALHEKQNIEEVQEYLHNTELEKVIQYEPQIPYALAEEMGVRYTPEFEQQLIFVLQKMGFDRVFSSGYGTDIMIREEARLLADRIRAKSKTPLISSDCPAWVKHAEQSYTSYLNQLSPIKSGPQISGVLVKSWLAATEGKTPQDYYLVSASVCTARKQEASRDGMMQKGIPDIDNVITVRELAKLIQLYGVDMGQADTLRASAPMNFHSSAACLPEVSGGHLEALMRSLTFELTGKDPEGSPIKKLRQNGGVRELSLTIGKQKVNVAVVSGLKQLEAYLYQFEKSDKTLHYIEVMACPDGCINGGGQPFRKDDSILKNRRRQVYAYDDKQAVKFSHRNPELKVLYENFLNEEGKADSLFGIRFSPREVLL